MCKLKITLNTESICFKKYVGKISIELLLLLFYFASFSSEFEKRRERKKKKGRTEAGKRHLYDVQFAGEDGIA